MRELTPQLADKMIETHVYATEVFKTDRVEVNIDPNDNIKVFVYFDISVFSHYMTSHDMGDSLTVTYTTLDPSTRYTICVFKDFEDVMEAIDNYASHLIKLDVPYLIEEYCNKLPPEKSDVEEYDSEKPIHHLMDEAGHFEFNKTEKELSEEEKTIFDIVFNQTWDLFLESLEEVCKKHLTVLPKEYKDMKFNQHHFDVEEEKELEKSLNSQNKSAYDIEEVKAVDNYIQRIIKPLKSEVYLQDGYICMYVKVSDKEYNAYSFNIKIGDEQNETVLKQVGDATIYVGHSETVEGAFRLIDAFQDSRFFLIESETTCENHENEMMEYPLSPEECLKKEVYRGDEDIEINIIDKPEDKFYGYNVGDLYASFNEERRDGVMTVFMTVVLCTGEGDTPRQFEGVVVKNTDKTSFHQKGMYSKYWEKSSFSKYTAEVRIDGAVDAPKVNDACNG